MSKDKPTLIYLDDEEINLILFYEMFKHDFDIYTTTSPEEALAYVKDCEPRFILTDQMMPMMTGTQFLEKVRDSELSSTPKRLIISGFAKANDLDNALEEKLMDHFVMKPWSYPELKKLLLDQR